MRRYGRPQAGIVKSLLLAMVAAMFAMAYAVVPAAPANAASNGQWSVFPITLPGHAPRAYLQPVLTPGKPYVDSVTVANYTADPLTFHLYGADAINTPGGGLSLRRRTDVQSDIGKWITLPYSLLTVPARSYSVVPFAIVPPPHAVPGDHVGGIVAEETQGIKARAGSTPITVVEAVGVRVYGRVVGPLHPSLSLQQVSLSVKSSAATQFGGTVRADVGFIVVNSGNTVLSPRTTVTLSTPFGTAARRTVAVDLLLPGFSVPFAVSFPGVNAYGHLHARVQVVTPHATESRSATAWVVPWALFAVILVVLAMLVIAFRVRRRRRKTRQPKEPESAETELTATPLE
jgi:hypothetical protein